MWDLAEDVASIDLVETMFAADKPVATVCHAAAVFRHTKAPDGAPLVRGKKVAGFTNTEEAAVGLAAVVPYLVEDMLKESGGAYSKADNFQSHVITDGNLVTGQNPASSKGVAAAVVNLLSRSPGKTSLTGRMSYAIFSCAFGAHTINHERGLLAEISSVDFSCEEKLYQRFI